MGVEVLDAVEGAAESFERDTFGFVACVVGGFAVVVIALVAGEIGHGTEDLLGCRVEHSRCAADGLGEAHAEMVDAGLELCSCFGASLGVVGDFEIVGIVAVGVGGLRRKVIGRSNHAVVSEAWNTSYMGAGEVV